MKWIYIGSSAVLFAMSFCVFFMLIHEKLCNDPISIDAGSLPALICSLQ